MQFLPFVWGGAITIAIQQQRDYSFSFPDIFAYVLNELSQTVAIYLEGQK